jgi:SAM-dependent methyltransferase
MIRLLDNPVVWETSRFALDAVFGHYRRRIQRLRDWGLLTQNESMLDIGCGIGQFSKLSQGDYLGIDMNERHIDYATKMKRRDNITFRCADAATLLNEGSRFDIVLMVDILHHLSDAQCADVLTAASKLAKRCVVSFEPVAEQSNFVARWMNDHDQGEYVRPLAGLQELFERSPLAIVESVPLRIGIINSQAIMARTRTK